MIYIKRCVLLAVILLLLCSGCSAPDQPLSTPAVSQSEMAPAETPVSASPAVEGLYNVAYDIHMSKHLVFIPNYLGRLYGVGTAYEESIDDWADLDYLKAEAGFESVERTLLQAETLYYPDDLAMVQYSLACVKMELADYKPAYDLLINAYVTMYEVYDKEGIPEDKRFFYRAPELTLCRYYYAVGDYERCIMEIHRLRDDLEEHNDQNTSIDHLRLFMLWALNDMEGTVYNARGQYEDAIALYMDSVHRINDYSDSHEDITIIHVLDVELSRSMADWFAQFPQNEEFAEYAETLYDKALNIIEVFGNDSDLSLSMKSFILACKGKFLSNFTNRKQEAVKCFLESAEILSSVYEQGKYELHYVETECMIGDMFGFILGATEEAVYAYNAALEDSISFNGYNHPDTILAYESLGRFYGNRLGDTEKAIEYLNHALEICRNLLIEKSATCADIYLQLAGCYHMNDELEKSEECLNKAYTLYGDLGIHILQDDGTWK